MGAVCSGPAEISSYMCPILPFLNTVTGEGCFVIDCWTVSGLGLAKGGFAPTFLLQTGARAMAHIFM